MTATCLCGDVSITIAAKPTFIHDCNCTLCRKTGAAWGYFTNADTQVEGDTLSVMRTDKPDPAAEVHSCKTCSATTHFGFARSFLEKHGPVDLVGVNMRLFDQKLLEGVEVRFPDGRDWSGDGAFDYRREPACIGGSPPW